jgi:hypothetical protein
MTCSGRNFVPCSCHWDGVWALLILSWCVRCVWMLWAGLWCLETGDSDPGLYCAWPCLIYLDDTAWCASGAPWSSSEWNTQSVQCRPHHIQWGCHTCHLLCFSLLVRMATLPSVLTVAGLCGHHLITHCNPNPFPNGNVWASHWYFNTCNA